jgi:hypothetical protein
MLERYAPGEERRPTALLLGKATQIFSFIFWQVAASCAAWRANSWLR